MTYEKHCSDIKDFNIKNGTNHKPMPKEKFIEMIGLPTVIKHEPLAIRPKPKPTAKKQAVEPKAKKIPKPKKPKAVKPPKERKHMHDRTSLEGMTEEEIKAHRSKLQRARIAKKKAEGWTEPKRTPEQIEQRKAYFKKYYARKKNDPAFKAKRSAANRKYDAKRYNRIDMSFVA